MNIKKKYGRNRITPENYEKLKEPTQLVLGIDMDAKECEEYWEKLPIYERKELQMAGGGEIPEYLTEMQQRKDDEVIEKIMEDRLLENETKKVIGLEEFYRVKREYPDTFISLMSKQPLELRLKLITCFDCLKNWYRAQSKTECQYEKRAKKYYRGEVINQYEQILIKECPICAQNRL